MVTGRECVRPPAHVVPDRLTHGVARYASQVAGAVGAAVVAPDEALRLSHRDLHVHVSDALFGSSCEETARFLADLGRRHRVTLTLHDVPQPGDGPVFGRRRRAYLTALEAAAAWAVSSRHERVLVERHLQPGTPGAVVPLPVLALPRPRTARTRSRSTGATGATVVGVFGWVYPGKGHAEVLEACTRLERPVTLRVLGRAAPGHEHLERELAALARSRGVRWEVTGWIPEAQLPTVLDEVDVPVAAHRNVSASGSVNTWVAAGRRPLVAAGTYAREMQRLRPGTLTLVDAAPRPLAEALRHASAHPGSTRLGPAAPTGPHLADVAASYLAWWSDVHAG